MDPEPTTTTTVKSDGVRTSHHEDGPNYEDKHSDSGEAQITYEDVYHEPKIHLRTWIAVAAMLLLNYVQVIALQGPPVVVSTAQLTPWQTKANALA